MKRLTILFALFITLLSGCSDDSTTNQASSSSANNTSSAPTAANQGVVKRATHAGGYSYVQVEKNGKEMWIAGPTANIKRGQTVSWTGASLMKNFTSKTMRKTFEEILFVQKLEVVN